jgi:hypothetical protein
VSETRYVARASRVAARMIGDEMMIMSGLDSSLYSLNATASVLWQAADGVTPLADIVLQRICARFDVEPDVALRDAEALIDDLTLHGILLVSELPIAEAVAPARTAP